MVILVIVGRCRTFPRTRWKREVRESQLPDLQCEAIWTYVRRSVSWSSGSDVVDGCLGFVCHVAGRHLGLGLEGVSGSQSRLLHVSGG